MLNALLSRQPDSPLRPQPAEVSSTLLTLIVLPAIFRWFDGQQTEPEPLA